MQKDKDGKYVCPVCSKPMNSITWSTYDSIRWDWDSKVKRYVQSTHEDADDPKCGECDIPLDMEFATELIEEDSHDK
ncbi:MAG: hypothetical protein LHV68_05155 [Elusimicrobia bacterium]|nr:hypothetical protein [Candidatus Liberimonas magnetica]